MLNIAKNRKNNLQDIASSSLSRPFATTEGRKGRRSYLANSRALKKEGGEVKKAPLRRGRVVVDEICFSAAVFL